MKRIGIESLAAPIALAVLLAPTTARADKFRADLEGFEEAPSISSVGSGEFQAHVNEDDTISYQLSYADLEGSVTQAHIHFGQRAVNGGVSVFLCTNVGGGPAGTQACPPSPATITGTITPADVVGPAAQGIAATEFAELLKAIRNDMVYINVHSSKFPGGEIRGQGKATAGSAHHAH